VVLHQIFFGQNNCKFQHVNTPLPPPPPPEIRNGIFPNTKLERCELTCSAKIKIETGFIHHSVPHGKAAQCNQVARSKRCWTQNSAHWSDRRSISLSARHLLRYTLTTLANYIWWSVNWIRNSETSSITKIVRTHVFIFIEQKRQIHIRNGSTRTWDMQTFILFN
jgi:hypothetical protein